VNVRVIAATNRHLDRMVADGVFRRDLYQRLHVFQIEIPPLRERPEDIVSQAEYFLRHCQPGREPAIRGFGPRVLEALTLLPFEGNTRQLDGLIRHAVAQKDTGSLLEMEDLPRWVFETLACRPAPHAGVALLDRLVDEVCDGSCTLAEAIEQLECRLLQKILRQTGGNRTRAADVLGLTPRSIFNKIKKYRLDMP
jgi:two-component system, NtrC family, response regulator AtoC